MTARPSTPSVGKQIAALYALGMVRCRMCDGVLTATTTEWDHVHQHATGGADDAENLRPLCEPCHKIKTRNDAKARGKVRRLRGETCNGPKRPINSRGFDKTRRRKMNGTVEARPDERARMR